MGLEKLKFDKILSKFLNNWVKVSVCPLSYGCMWEVVKHQRDVSVFGDDGLVRP